ncbi:hypothetical protein [Pseudomonas sp. S2_C03]
MTTALSVASLLCGVVLIGMFFWIVFALYLYRTKIEFLLTLLKNNAAIRERMIFNFGIWGKIALIGAVAGIVTFPRLFVISGGISSEELTSIPLPLKKKLALLSWSSVILVTSLICAVSITEVIKMYGI